jgi:hypothetical protein
VEKLVPGIRCMTSGRRLLQGCEPLCRAGSSRSVVLVRDHERCSSNDCRSTAPASEAKACVAIPESYAAGSQCGRPVLCVLSVSKSGLIVAKVSSK